MSFIEELKAEVYEEYTSGRNSHVFTICSKGCLQFLYLALLDT